MGSLVALDANLFIYSLEGNVEFGMGAANVLKIVASGGVKAIASELVYLEVLAGKNISSVAGVNHAKAFLAGLGITYSPITLEVLTLAARLRREIHSLKAPDAIHLACAIENHAEYFITNDQNVLKQKIEGIKIINLAQSSSLLFPATSTD